MPATGTTVPHGLTVLAHRCDAPPGRWVDSGRPNQLASQLAVDRPESRHLSRCVRQPEYDRQRHRHVDPRGEAARRSRGCARACGPVVGTCRCRPGTARCDTARCDTARCWRRRLAIPGAVLRSRPSSQVHVLFRPRPRALVRHRTPAQQEVEVRASAQLVHRARHPGRLQLARSRRDPLVRSQNLRRRQVAPAKRGGARLLPPSHDAGIALRFLPAAAGGVRIDRQDRSRQRRPELAAGLLSGLGQDQVLYRRGLLVGQHARGVGDDPGPDRIDHPGFQRGRGLAQLARQLRSELQMSLGGAGRQRQCRGQLVRGKRADELGKFSVRSGCASGGRTGRSAGAATATAVCPRRTCRVSEPAEPAEPDEPAEPAARRRALISRPKVDSSAGRRRASSAMAASSLAVAHEVSRRQARMTPVSSSSPTRCSPLP